MNEVDALATLELPATTRISVARLKPDDVIVLEFEGCLSQETSRLLKERLEEVWPGRKSLVLANGLKMKIVEG